jgi:hypothetical protein
MTSLYRWAKESLTKEQLIKRTNHLNMRMYFTIFYQNNQSNEILDHEFPSFFLIEQDKGYCPESETNADRFFSINVYGYSSLFNLMVIKIKSGNNRNFKI